MPIMKHLKPQKNSFALSSPTCQYFMVKYHYNTALAHTTSENLLF